MINVAILGSTGSIGVQTLQLIRRFPREFKVTALTAGTMSAFFNSQVDEFKPSFYGAGTEKSTEAAAIPAADIVVIAVSGIAALKPVMAAAKAGKTIALANKEAVVAAGQLIMDAAKAHGATIIPVDSEHSAIFQCLSGNRREDLKRVILTASGGPLLNVDKEKLINITPEEVIKHPRWNMGKKISVDSATMINKGLEVIEAARLFDLSPRQIDVVIHPQSIIHSMVEYCDGSHMAQLSNPDMTVPISRALFYPNRCPDTNVPSIDFDTLKTLNFAPLKKGTFPCFDLARQAYLAGGIMPCVLNAADEAAVGLFLSGKIPFLKIPDIIETALNKCGTNVKHSYGIDDIINLDAEIKKDILSCY